MAAAGFIRGVVGQIRWAYYTAAAIEGFTVIRTVRPGGASSWSLQATIVNADKFKMAQRPLVFVAPHAKGRWAWLIEDFHIVGGQLTAELGPPEEYS